jgi:hypothetical protein
MKTIVYIFIIALSILGCSSQNRYFTPEGIIDKTEEYVEDNKGWILLEDKVSVDGYTRIGDSIFGGEIACNIRPLKKIDIKTFEVLPGTKYARDINHVYYPLAIPCIDYSDCGVCFYGKIIINEANPETFKYLGKEYAVDGHNAYFRGEKIQDADGQTFRIVNGPEFFYFAVDSNKVYIHNKVFKEADPKTFYFDSTDKRNIPGMAQKIIIADKAHEWQYSPPTTIEEIEKR